MDPSALIFVALAVAWAVYLIPKALEQHEEGMRARTVDRFSQTLRVLARRESGERDQAEPTTAQKRQQPAKAEKRARKRGRTAGRPDVARSTPAPRTAGAVAAGRRRNVLSAILVALVTVAVLAGVSIIDWVWTAVPGGMLLAWLVACRLMVRRERRVHTAGTRPQRRPQPQYRPQTRPAVEQYAEPHPEPGHYAEPDTDEVAVVDEPLAVPAEPAYAEQPAATADGSWQPMSVPLPTYVTKPAVRRTVRTIDLDSTGVFSSARNDADSALAREAEEAARVQQDQPQRATGS